MQEAVLTAIASGGRRGGDEILPRVTDYLLDLDHHAPTRLNEIVASAATRLTKNGLVVFSEGRYILSKEGINILERWRRNDFSFPKPKRWDKKWRIVIFDIPEKRKRTRDEIRGILVSAGFQKLQDSVWVYPYDCEDIIGLLKTDYGIGRDMLYIIADQIENDRYLRMDFGLIE